MTSTNDGKDVKSNQTSGHKGKIYYIELYKSLDSRLSADTTGSERTTAVCEAWRRVHSLCQHSAPNTHPLLLAWLQRHTSFTILQNDWPKATDTSQSKEQHKWLEEAIDEFITECREAKVQRNGVSPPWESQLLQRALWFKSTLSDPWSHPVLRTLLKSQDNQLTDEEVLEWLKQERGITFVTRLKQLAASRRCRELALRLAAAVMARARAGVPVVLDVDQTTDTPKTESSFMNVLQREAGFKGEVWNLITDIEFVLLHSDSQSKCIELAKQTPLSSCYNLVNRLQNRLETSPRDKKIWKNAKEVATLIAQVVIARCMVIPTCTGVPALALYRNAKALVRLLPAQQLPAAAAALAAPAPTATHLHKLAVAVHAQCKDERKSFVCELYVRAITAGMNELERLKLKTEKEAEARCTEQTLSKWFSQLGSLLSASARLSYECFLTAFSVHPSQEMFHQVRNAPTLEPLHKDTQESKPETNSEFGSWANDSRTQTNLVKTSETLNMKSQKQANVLSTAIFAEGEALGLNADLCQDLAVLISGPRVKTLTWDMERESLLENCRTYMERTHGGTRALTTELKYLNLDPRSFQHLPEEDDEENDAYYGIEKGYEHLVERAEDNWEEEIMYEAEQTDVSHSTGDSATDVPKRKKKSKPLPYSSDEEVDPLDLDDMKRSEKKERSHSKEKRKEKHKVQEGTLKCTDESKEHSQEKTKEIRKKEKKKERKERKKKDKMAASEVPTSDSTQNSKGLSRLVGMKVARQDDRLNLTDTSTPLINLCASDSDYDSQGKSSVNSEGNDPNVLFDGLYSMDEIKSPERSMPASLQRSSHSFGICEANNTGLNNSTPNLSGALSKSQAIVNRSNAPNQANNMVKKSIKKLLEFRRNKNSNNNTASKIIKPAIPCSNSLKLSPLISNIQKSNSNEKWKLSLVSTSDNNDFVKSYSHHGNVGDSKKVVAEPAEVVLPITNTSQKANYNVIEGKKSFQYAPYPIKKVSPPAAIKQSITSDINRSSSKSFKPSMNVESSSQNQYKEFLKQKSSVVIKKQPTKSCSDTLSQIQFQEFLKEQSSAQANSVDRLQGTSRQYQTKNTQNGSRQSISNSSTPSQVRHQDFLKELRESANAGTTKSTSGTNSLQIPKSVPKQQKKVDNAPNTFSRRNYLHKTKQNDNKTKLNLNQAKPGLSISMEEMHNLGVDYNKVSNLQTKGEIVISRLDVKNKGSNVCPKITLNKVDNSNSLPQQKPTSSVLKQHPIMSHILSSNEAYGTKLPSGNENINTTQRHVTVPNSNLSEKDQNDLLLLLRQQSKMNIKPTIKTEVENTSTCTNLKMSNIDTNLSNSNSSIGCQSPNTNLLNPKVITQAVKTSVIKSNENLSITASEPKKSRNVKGNSKNPKQQSANNGNPTSDWESVMNALLAHKTPSRGPNALDVALKKDSFQKRQSNETKTMAQCSASSAKSERTLLKNSIKLSSSNTSSLPKKQNVQDFKPRSENNITKLANTKANQIETAKRSVIKKCEKHIPSVIQNSNDPFISGIPNSDFDLLGDLMDDDLRQEIGELLADDEAYGMSTISTKNKNMPSDLYFDANKTNTSVRKPQLIIDGRQMKNQRGSIITSCSTNHKEDLSIKSSNIEQTNSMSASALNQNPKLRIISNELVTPPTLTKKSNTQICNNIQLNNVAIDRNANDHNPMVVNMNNRPVEIINKNDGSFEIPSRTENADIPKVEMSNLNVFDPTQVVLTVPQSAPNVMLISNEVIYNPYTIQHTVNQSCAGFENNSYLSLNQNPSNVTLFSSPTYPVIIDGAVSVPIIQSVPTNITVVPNITLNTLSAVDGKPDEPAFVNCDKLENSTYVNDEVLNINHNHQIISQTSESTNAEIEGSFQEPNRSIDESLEKTITEQPTIFSKGNQSPSSASIKLSEGYGNTYPHISSRRIYEAKNSVLNEMDSTHETIPESNSYDTLPKNQYTKRHIKECTVITDQKRLQLKRMRILNRKINHRCDNPIPLTYEPIKIANLELQQKVINCEDERDKETANNSAFIESKLAKTNETDDAPDNNTDHNSTCRRILLRSSNNLMNTKVENVSNLKISKITKKDKFVRKGIRPDSLKDKLGLKKISKIINNQSNQNLIPLPPIPSKEEENQGAKSDNHNVHFAEIEDQIPIAVIQNSSKNIIEKPSNNMSNDQINNSKHNDLSKTCTNDKNSISHPRDESKDIINLSNQNADESIIDSNSKYIGEPNVPTSTDISNCYTKIRDDSIPEIDKDKSVKQNTLKTNINKVKKPNFLRFEDKIMFDELPNNSNNPLIKCVRVKLPNGNSFKVTISGKLNVEMDEIFEEPTIKAMILKNINNNKKCTLNVKQVKVKSQAKSSTVTTHVQDVSHLKHSEQETETIDLVSDDEESNLETFQTEYGIYNCACIDKKIFLKHQEKLLQKCTVNLVNCKILQDISISNLSENMIPTGKEPQACDEDCIIVGDITKSSEDINKIIDKNDCKVGKEDNNDNTRLITNEDVLKDPLSLSEKIINDNNINKSIDSEIENNTSKTPMNLQIISKECVLRIDRCDNLLEKLKIQRNQCFVNLVRCDNVFNKNQSNIDYSNIETSARSNDNAETEYISLQKTSVQEASVHELTLQETSLQGTPVMETGIQEICTKEISVQELLLQEALVPGTSIQKASAHETTAQGKIVQETPLMEISKQEKCSKEVSAQELSLQEELVPETSVKKASAGKTTLQGKIVQETPLMEASKQEICTKEGSVQELPLKEASVPGTFVQTASARETTPQGKVEQETSLQKTPLMETSKQEICTKGVSVQELSLQEELVPGTSVQKPLARERTAQGKIVQETSLQKTPLKEASTQEICTKKVSVQELSLQEASVPGTSVQKVSARETTGQGKIVQETSIQETPLMVASKQAICTKEVSVQELSLQEALVPGTSLQKASSHETTVQETFVKETPVQETSYQETPLMKASIQEICTKEISAQELSLQEALVPRTSLQKSSARKTTAHGTFVQKTPLMEASIQEICAKEVSVQEVLVSGTLQKASPRETTAHGIFVEEIPVQEKSIQEICINEQNNHIQKPLVPATFLQEALVPGISLQEALVPETSLQEASIYETTPETFLEKTPIMEASIHEICTQEVSVQKISSQIQEGHLPEKTPKMSSMKETPLHGESLQETSLEIEAWQRSESLAIVNDFLTIDENNSERSSPSLMENFVLPMTLYNESNYNSFKYHSLPDFECCAEWFMTKLILTDKRYVNDKFLSDDLPFTTSSESKFDDRSTDCESDIESNDDSLYVEENEERCLKVQVPSLSKITANYFAINTEVIGNLIAAKSHSKIKSNVSPLKRKIVDTLDMQSHKISKVDNHPGLTNLCKVSESEDQNRTTICSNISTKTSLKDIDAIELGMLLSNETNIYENDYIRECTITERNKSSSPQIFKECNKCDIESIDNVPMQTNDEEQGNLLKQEQISEHLQPIENSYTLCSRYEVMNIVNINNRSDDNKIHSTADNVLNNIELDKSNQLPYLSDENWNHKSIILSDITTSFGSKQNDVTSEVHLGFAEHDSVSTLNGSVESTKDKIVLQNKTKEILVSDKNNHFTIATSNVINKNKNDLKVSEGNIEDKSISRSHEYLLSNFNNEYLNQISRHLEESHVKNKKDMSNIANSISTINELDFCEEPSDVAKKSIINPIHKRETNCEEVIDSNCSYDKEQITIEVKDLEKKHVHEYKKSPFTIDNDKQDNNEKQPADDQSVLSNIEILNNIKDICNTENIENINNDSQNSSQYTTRNNNNQQQNVTLVYKGNSRVVLNGSIYEDPVIGTCYVFPILNRVTITDNDSVHDDTSVDVVETEVNKIFNIHNKIENKSDLESFDLNVILPKNTYAKKKIHGDLTVHTRMTRTNLKRKILDYDSKANKKKYRKSKNIDYPKFTVCTTSETAYGKEYKNLFNYWSSIKFSFSRPFHKDYIDVSDTLKCWPILNVHIDEETKTEDKHLLFIDDDEKKKPFDPFRQTLAEEISSEYVEPQFTSDQINETNFSMGFGEGSDRVFQNSEDGDKFSKFSAATLSDVKQCQPFLLSDNYNKCNNELHESKVKQIETCNRFFSLITLRDKVRSFFKKSTLDLRYNCLLENSDKKKYFDLDSNRVHPYDIFSTDFIEPASFETIVNVVQVGQQLPVSAAAQNPVTCDPRVTQVTDASPQCSAENSPHEDLQSPVKTEYTELTTADISVPLPQEYERQTELQESSKVPTHNENIPVEIVVSSEGKSNIHEQLSQTENDQNGNETDNLQVLVNKHIKNIEYSYDSNENTTSEEVQSNSEVSYDSIDKKETETTRTEQKQNGTVEKTDQIAHAMSAAGITPSPEPVIDSEAQSAADMFSPKICQDTASTPNNFTKTSSINAMMLQQALAQILPPPLNQTNSQESNQVGSNSSIGSQVLHIVQGKNANVNQITVVENTQNSVISNSNTPVLHIVQNKNPNNNTNNVQHANSYSGLSLVDTGLQQGNNQLLHIVNTGNQKNNTGQILKRVNLLTNLANVQGATEQKMVQFVCKSADGKSIHLNAPHQRSMVLRLQPFESPNVQSNSKTPEGQDLSSTANNSNTTNKESMNGQHEIKSRSMYEENYAKFIQNSSSKTGPEKSTSLPKFNQAFGKQIFQDGNQKPSEINTNNSHLSSMNSDPENSECQSNDNNLNMEHISQINSPPLLLRKSPAPTTQTQSNIVQQIKQTIAPMMHGGVIYTRQIPVNIGGGQTINLITVPSTELVDDSNQKQQGDMKFVSQNEVESPVIKIIPQNQNTQNNQNNEMPSDESNNNHTTSTNENTPSFPPQHQPVLTQMRIKLPMLSKAPQMVSGARVVRPSFFQIQRNVIGGANQPVYQQLVLTAAPPLGQHTIRLPQTHTRQVKVASEGQSSSESQMSSSTLEQLREFDMVLEQVKERSTVQPNTTNNFCKLHTTSSDTTESSTTVTSTVTESTQQILYSIGTNQSLNVAYVNRKPTTTTAYVRSPDSSNAIDSPSSSTHSQIPHTATSESTSSEVSPQQNQPKAAKIGSKSKSRPKSTSHPPNSLKINTVPPKTSTQKPLEDEQTTQRILYILAEYKEQVENSPDKDKPAPRRRSNPPSNPSGSSKRKKSSSSSRRPGVRDLSPVQGDDTCRTMGSEDSSCGTSQGDCTENCLEPHSPQDSPRKVVRKLTFENETPTSTQPRQQPTRNVIVADGQTITVSRGTSGKPTTAVLMPANYILPVSMVKGGQQIAIVTNRGPKLLTVGGETGNALLLQRLIGPAGLKPVLTRPGVRHVRLPTAALHNLQAFNLATATPVHQPESAASPAPAQTPPELVDSRASTSPWADRESQDVKPERASSPEGSEPWHLTADPNDYSYEETVRTEKMDRTVLDAIPDRYSPDMEAQRIFDKMFDVDSKRSYIVDSQDETSRCAYDIDASDCDDKAYHQVVHKREGHRQHRLAHVSAAALRHKYAILEHELRLQKSLSEECEDLGVDSPSASELFPEAELLFSSSPAHDAQQHSHTPQPTILNQSGIPQPDIDDQIATDHLLQSDIDDQQDLGVTLGLDEGIVTVSEDGMQATIALDQEEFARSHPNTTFHSEPSEETEVQPFTITGLKGRHITSTIFHAGRAPATVLVTAPQTTVISQANQENVHHSVKYANIDHIINSSHGNLNLTKFDNILTDSRELHLSHTASAIVHSTGNATQVIRRVCYEDERRDARYLMDESDGLIAGDDAKMIAEDSSREATLESMADGDEDNSSPERHAELFWESNSASERSERGRHVDYNYSSDSEKCCKSPFDETNSTDSSGVGTHMRLDSVIKEARLIERAGSGSSDDHPPLRTYPAKRMYHHSDDVERSLSGKTRAGFQDEREYRTDNSEVRRRSSVRGVVKRGCHCCNGSPVPPKPKKSKKKPTIDFTN